MLRIAHSQAAVVAEYLFEKDQTWVGWLLKLISGA